MTVDLTNPKSVAAWVAIAPERNRAQLAGLRRLPLFRPLLDAVFEAQRQARAHLQETNT